ncbi:dihydrolipoamide acetyltransferase family protein [Bacillaceae bacterium IKA-2]|nr:dihydrolipoamide acetyltransferase family protein [Bacillaceae bacterium IKA-2]
MATEIKMPQLGESVTEGTISKWLVKQGDKVNKYDPIAEVMTDKVNAEVPSSYTGTVVELVAKEDETIEVGGVICLIAVEGETAVVKSSSSKTVPSEVEAPAASQANDSQKTRYSPAVLRLASENNLDLTVIKGTGRGGRITRKDILLLVESGNMPKQEEQIAEGQSRSEAVENPISHEPEVEISLDHKPKTVVTTSAGDIEIPVSGVRKAIAANMVKSKHEAPHAWMTVEVDVTNLVQYRNEMKANFTQKEGFNLTFLPFFIKAVVEALKEFPQLNSMWAGDKIIQKKAINISIAVAAEDALYVPVIKDADDKTIKGIAKELNLLADKVRNKTISSNDMKAGTFTVNNTGSFGSILSTPIINYPQAAILSVESIVKRPVVMANDAIAIRHMVNLCLSLDHRVLDGLVCGKFLARVKEKLESISKDNTQVY